jgi:triacylglycerol lipase
VLRRILVVVATLAAALAAVAASPPPAGAAQPDPVIIVAGTFSPAFANEPLAARLRADGYTVRIFELPNLGTGDISASGRALGDTVDAVLAQSGATRVDLVGHSQGGLVARDYVKYDGGAAKVDSLVTLGTPNYGTYIANIVAFFGLGDCIGVIACQQMEIGSSYLNALNAGDDTIGSVRYTNLYTLQDELVRPVGNAAMRDGAANVLIQSQCWLQIVGHVGLILDGTVYSGVVDALRHEPIRLNCFAL